MLLRRTLETRDAVELRVRPDRGKRVRLRVEVRIKGDEEKRREVREDLVNMYQVLKSDC